MLKRWLVFPLKDVAPIVQRQEVVEHFFRHPDMREDVRTLLTRIGDLERIISKVAVGRVNPREMVQLRVALEAIEPIRNLCMEEGNDSLRILGE